MKILCVCEEGNNRSVTLAQRLRYHSGKSKYETIAVGTKRHSTRTLCILIDWADLIITVDKPTEVFMLNVADAPSKKFKVIRWEIGPDKYPRPFNKELMRICDRLIKENPLKEGTYEEVPAVPAAHCSNCGRERLLCVCNAGPYP